MNMTSNCDVTSSAHHIKMITIYHWMKTPPWKFSAYATGCLYRFIPILTFCGHFTRSGVSKLRPAGQNRSAKTFHRAREVISSIMMYWQKIYWFGTIWHIPKQWRYVRCPALVLLFSSLCGPLTKKFGDPCNTDQRGPTTLHLRAIF